MDLQVDNYGTLFVFDLKETPVLTPDPEQASGVRFRQIGPEEAMRLQAAMEMAGDYPAGDVVSRLKNNRLAFVLEIEPTPRETGGIVSFGWVALEIEPMGNSGFAFNPAPGDCWLYDFATLPAYRGRGYYPALLRFILQQLALRGIRYAWIGTAPGNGKSARSIARAGFTLVAKSIITPDPSGKGIRFEALPEPGVKPEILEAAQKVNISLNQV